MSRQPGRVRATAIGFFIFIGFFLLADLDRQNQADAEAEEPKVVSEYCAGLWSECSGNLPYSGATYLMTRRDLGGGYYEDTYRFKGRIHRINGLYEVVWRVQTYRGLFSIGHETRRRTLYSPEEALEDTRLRNDENQISNYTSLKTEFLVESVEAYFEQLMSGQQVSMKVETLFKIRHFACKGLAWCSSAANSRQYDENEQTTTETDEWIPVGEEIIELPDGNVRTLVFDLLDDISDERIWYDPQDERIVRKGSTGVSNEYRFHFLRLGNVSESKTK